MLGEEALTRGLIAAEERSFYLFLKKE